MSDTELTAKQTFALALDAINAIDDGYKHNSLTGCKPDGKKAAKAVKYLKKNWHVRTKEDLLSDLRWLYETGYNEAYEMGIAMYGRKESRVFKEKQPLSIRGWDLGRMILITRRAAAAGILEEKEAWNWIMLAAYHIMDEFSDWEEYGYNYIEGYYYAFRDGGDAYETIVDDLTDYEDTLWDNIEWLKEPDSKRKAESLALTLLPRYNAPMYTEEQFRALAFGAVLAERNRNSHQFLFTDRTGYSAEKWGKELLSGGWGVDSRADLISRLEWLLTEGHRVGFQNDLKNGELPKFLKKGPEDILAWDFGRMVNVARWGYGAGYIDGNEAWNWLLTASYGSQLAFNSWKEFGESYMAGRSYWAGKKIKEMDDETKEAYDRLLYPENKKSPWIAIPWERHPEADSRFEEYRGKCIPHL